MLRKRAIVLDLDGEGDCAELLLDYALIEIYHEPAAYFARLPQPREDKQIADDTIGTLHQAAA